MTSPEQQAAIDEAGRRGRAELIRYLRGKGATEDQTAKFLADLDMLAERLSKATAPRETDPADDYCPECKHPWSYHNAERGHCVMPVVEGTNLPKTAWHERAVSCACRRMVK